MNTTVKLNLKEIRLAQTALHAHLEQLKKYGNEQEIHSCIALCDKLSEAQVNLEEQAEGEETP